MLFKKRFVPEKEFASLKFIVCLMDFRPQLRSLSVTCLLVNTDFQPY